MYAIFGSRANVTPLAQYQPGRGNDLYDGDSEDENSDSSERAEVQRELIDHEIPSPIKRNDTPQVGSSLAPNGMAMSSGSIMNDKDESLPPPLELGLEDETAQAPGSIPTRMSSPKESIPIPSP